MIKVSLFISLCCCSVVAFSQNATKYYDSNWHEIPEAQAYYRTVFGKEGNNYTGTSYYQSSGKIYSTTTYTDSGFKQRMGVQKQYYESGKLFDSVVYNENGGYKTYDEFSETGKLAKRAFYDEGQHTMIGERFDSVGSKIPGYFTFQKAATFPGGMNGWAAYLQKNLKADAPNRKKAPVGNYTVVVSFLVDKQGKISEVKAENDPGYGTAEEAVRVIKSGPDWIPATQNEKTVIYRQKQNITFQVSDGRR